MKILILIVLLAISSFSQLSFKDQPDLMALIERQSAIRSEKIRLEVKYGMHHELVVAKEAEIQALDKEIKALIRARTPKTQAEWWRETETGWREVARTAREPLTLWFYETFARRGDNVEVWLKQYDPEAVLKARKNPKLKKYSHTLEFTVFSCRDRRVSVERNIMYDTAGNVLATGPGEIHREPVPPESVFEIMFRHFCVPIPRPQIPS